MSSDSAPEQRQIGEYLFLGAEDDTLKVDDGDGHSSEICTDFETPLKIMNGRNYFLKSAAEQQNNQQMINEYEVYGEGNMAEYTP